MNVRQIVIAHLQAIGADGLCAEECGCGMDDFMPCGNPDIDACKPAKRHDCDGTCGCFWDGLSSDCYRPIDTPNEPICGNPATGTACQNESEENCGDCIALIDTPNEPEETHI